jgi:serine protease AprX
LVLALSLSLLTIPVLAETEAASKPSTAEIARRAAAEGELAYKLTTPEEFRALLGPAENEKTTNDGGMEILDVRYSNVKARFGRMREFSAPFTLLWINAGMKGIDIGQERQIVLRSEGDLNKFDTFWGFANVSLARLDLRGHIELIDKMPFDSRTVWPESNKMPSGFDPAALLEEGKNPGLGIRSLHKQGIDGKGIGIAILDQPLLKDHIEYKDQLVLYEKKHLLDMPPAMHGAPIASIAVGKNCGVAPKASLYYFAMRMTAMPDNKIYCNIIDKIIKMNEEAGASEKIRVVSISTGTFRQQKNYELWKETLKKAEQNGIMVVTCSGQWLRYGTLKLIPGKDPDNPLSYERGKYSTSNDVLLVPSSNKATASHHGPEIYTYDTEGGMSQAAPYLAGLAALAYQVKPDIDPKTIVDLWLKTAVRTDAGPVVNPVGFIEAVRETK